MDGRWRNGGGRSHGHRIGRDEVRGQGLVVEDLEDSQELQQAVLTAYHLTSIAFDQSRATKLFITAHDRTWMKDWEDPTLHVHGRSPLWLQPAVA
jgi:hypothetical protein